VTLPSEPPRTCLVAEDQALIAMLLQDQLEDSGFEVVGPYASCATALAWLRQGTPTFALVDYMLSDGPCVELARELRRRGIPFAVLSGYDHGSPQGEVELADAVWLPKPITFEHLQRAIRNLIPATPTL
jgi:DNA-binding response OmpR family regulator